jgi:hypothetical protein
LIVAGANERLCKNEEDKQTDPDKGISPWLAIRYFHVWYIVDESLRNRPKPLLGEDSKQPFGLHRHLIFEYWSRMPVPQMQPNRG